MNMKELCSGIDLQSEMTQMVLAFYETLDYENLRENMEKLNSPMTWDEGVKSLQETFGEDPSGIKMLSCELACALDTYKKYKEKGIPDEIFIATMKAFSRFVKEHFDSYGSYGFDRGWWTPRQLSGKEFRIGELEYETIEEEGKKIISIHIPSDGVIRQPELRQSYLDARKFFQQYVPEYATADMICNTWMLSPALKELLPVDSNIIRFQKSFVVDYVDYENNNFMEWVYKRMDIPLEQLPENTTLQRKIKAFILNGGKIGWANGKLVNDPFLF